MIGSFIKKLFGGQPSLKEDSKIQSQLAAATSRLDFDDPETRIGTQLYLILRKQFEIIGKPEGEFPTVHPFASDSAMGALIGTAFAIVRSEFDSPPNKVMIDAVITAFTLAFGASHGRQVAIKAMECAAEGNDEINKASDWAIEDTAASLEPNSVGTPAAFWHAVEGRI